MEYQVGQIIFVILHKERHIVPMQITEEIIRKTKSGQELSYKVCYGPSNNQEEILLSQIDGEVFASLEAVKQELLTRASSTVEGLVSSAEKRALNWFSSQEVSDDVTSISKK